MRIIRGGLAERRRIDFIMNEPGLLKDELLGTVRLGKHRKEVL